MLIIKEKITQLNLVVEQLQMKAEQMVNQDAAQGKGGETSQVNTLSRESIHDMRQNQSHRATSPHRPRKVPLTFCVCWPKT